LIIIKNVITNTAKQLATNAIGSGWFSVVLIAKTPKKGIADVNGQIRSLLGLKISVLRMDFVDFRGTEWENWYI